MNATFRIVRTELASLFYSPIAWLMLIVFIFQTATRYAGYLEVMAGRAYSGALTTIKVTEYIFSQRYRLFYDVINDLYLYVPLLTMGVIARELHSGSIKLLLSSPVSLTQIIVGKYIAMAAYFLTFILFLAGLMLLTGGLVEHFDYPLVLSGLLGICLLVLTYAAIGLFLSSLTSHQVVAAISTFAVLIGLNMIGTLGQRIPLVADLAYWLSISGRVDYLRAGLISSKDVLYFLSLIVLFLSFTHLKLSAGRKIEHVSTKIAKYLTVLFAITLFGYMTSLPSTTYYKDTTREKSQTLSHGSQAIMQEITGPWTITVYSNVLSQRGTLFLPSQRNRLERQMYDQYWRANPELDIEYVLYYGPSNSERLYEKNPGKSDEDLAREFAYQRGLDFDAFVSAEEAGRLAGVSMASEGYWNLYTIEWNGHKSVLRNFDDINYYPSERETGAALKRLLLGPARAAYVIGHGERSAFRRADTDHQLMASARNFRNGMRNQGFDVEEVRLDTSLPDDLDLLVIAAPEQAYTEVELANLNAYVARGGNLLVAGEPVSHDILNPIVEGFGVEFISGSVIEPKQEFPQDFIFGQLADDAADYGFEVRGRAAERPYLMNGAAVLHYTNDGPFEAIPIVVADGEGAILKTEARVPFDDTALGLAMRRDVDGKEQRLMIMADADFMSSAELTRTTLQTNNFEFVLDMLGWLGNGDYPVDVSRPPHIDDDIDLNIEDVFWVKLMLYGIVPGALFLWGGSLLIRRRRH